jgi:hypothetical protein
MPFGGRYAPRPRPSMAVSERTYRPKRPANNAARLGRNRVLVGEVAALRGRRLRERTRQTAPVALPTPSARRISCGECPAPPRVAPLQRRSAGAGSRPQAVAPFPPRQPNNFGCPPAALIATAIDGGVERTYRPKRPANNAARSGGNRVLVGEVAALWGRRLRGAPGKRRRSHSLRRQPSLLHALRGSLRSKATAFDSSPFSLIAFPSASARHNLLVHASSYRARRARPLPRVVLCMLIVRFELCGFMRRHHALLGGATGRRAFRYHCHRPLQTPSGCKHIAP